MAQQKIYLGTAPDDETGTKLRPAGGAINENFTELYTKTANLSGLNLVAGPVTKLAPGANPTATLTGAAPNYTLNLGLPEGAAGAGAPNSADILAIPEMGRQERSRGAAGVPEEPSLILDFIRGVHFASKTAIAATVLTLVTALGGISAVSRASTATFIGSDGLLKTAAANTLRVEYDPVTRERLGSLIENIARTNLATYSEQLGHASYGKGGVGIVDDYASDPFGLVAADKIVEDSATGQHLLTKTVTVTAGTVHTWSPCFKADERYIVRLQFDDGVATTHAAATFNLATGAVTDIIGPYIPTLEPYANGFWRTELIGLPTTTTARLVAYLGNAPGNFSYAGDGTSGLLGWGFQCEPGARKSSYIPAAGSAVTRAADAAVISLGQWLGGFNLTAMIEVRFNEVFSGGSAADLLRLVSSAGFDSYRLRQSVTIGGVDMLTQSGGFTQIDTGSYATPTGTVLRLAFGIDGSSYAFAKDNVLTYAGASGTPPAAAFDRLVIGSGFMGHIRRVLIWPQRLSNTKIQALSNQAWS